MLKYYSICNGRWLIFDYINFIIELFECIGILGCNGVGKLILVCLISGFELLILGIIEWVMSVFWLFVFLGGF